MTATPERSPVTLRYRTAADARRDRLPDVARGVIARLSERVVQGEVLPVRIELEKERLSIDAQARVLWMTPLARGALAGLGLDGRGRREEVQLDVLLGIRAASRAADLLRAALLPLAATPALPRLSVALLQPSRVLREVLARALVRFARHGHGWDLQLDAVGSTEEFLTAMTARRRSLAIIDGDALGTATAPLVDAVRSHSECARLPILVLGRTDQVRGDRHTVTVRKPVAMKSLLHTAEILVRG